MSAYSIIMPYYHRPLQFESTLASFAGQYPTDLYELIVIEDRKNLKDAGKHAAFLEVVDRFRDRVRFKILECREPIRNPCKLYNWGAAEAEGRYLVITNPECRHPVNILAGCTEEFARQACVIVCACASLGPDGRFERWFQHSIHRNARLCFCCVMEKKHYIHMGGFDPLFSDSGGIAWGDNDFADRLPDAGVPIVVRDDLLVEHQHHEKDYVLAKDHLEAGKDVNADYYLHKKTIRHYAAAHRQEWL
ncbi:MAG: glycosyltransferase [Lentisphaerae bacterium]|nr:glycosyltransferase [Lentisphaerota bacterium]